MPFVQAEYDDTVGEVIKNSLSFHNFYDAKHNFSIDYPAFWVINYDVVDYDADPGVDDGGVNLVTMEYLFTGTLSRLSVYNLYNHVSASLDSQSYMIGLEELVEDNCENSELYYGYMCSNQAIVEITTIRVHDKDWYRITYTFDAVYPDDPSVYSYRNIISETIVGNDIWGIESTNYFVNDISGNSMPPSAFVQSHNSFQFIDLSEEPEVLVPPFSRSPLSLRAVDEFGNSLDGVPVGQSIQLNRDLANGTTQDQDFIYFIQIINSDDTVIYLKWITGSLSSGQSLSPSLTWTPTDAGTYTATAFVWESVDEPIVLEPLLFTTIVVD